MTDRIGNGSALVVVDVICKLHLLLGRFRAGADSFVQLSTPEGLLDSLAMDSRLLFLQASTTVSLRVVDHQLERD